jgi:hypothetical protein
VSTPTADIELGSEEMDAFISQYAKSHGGTFKITIIPQGGDSDYDVVVHSGSDRIRIRVVATAACWAATDCILRLFPGVDMKMTLVICQILEGERGVGCVLIVIKRNKVVRVRFLRKVTHP